MIIMIEWEMKGETALVRSLACFACRFSLACFACLLACLLACFMFCASIHVIVRPAPTNGPYLLRVAVEHFAYDMRALRCVPSPLWLVGRLWPNFSKSKPQLPRLRRTRRSTFELRRLSMTRGFFWISHDDERGDALRVAGEPFRSERRSPRGLRSPRLGCGSFGPRAGGQGLLEALVALHHLINYGNSNDIDEKRRGEERRERETNGGGRRDETDHCAEE